MSEGTSLVPVERIEQAILFLRGQKVLLDEDLAELYGVETKVLNQAVRRNADRFPEDFMFQLTREELENLRSQIVTSRCYDSSSKSYDLPWGGRRTPPYAFTEQGVAMLSSVLRSSRAVQVNIEIMRAFVRLRQFLASHEELARKVAEMDQQLQMVTAVVWTLFAPDEDEAEAGPDRRIGFRQPEEGEEGAEGGPGGD
jgi:hypothetical protein